MISSDLHASRNVQIIHISCKDEEGLETEGGNSSSSVLLVC